MIIGDNGIVARAQEAKNKTDLAKEKEKLNFSITSAFTSESLYREITLESLQNALNKHFEKNDAVVYNDGDGNFTVKIKSSGSDYEVSRVGKIIEIQQVIDSDPGILNGDGTKEKPFLIESIEDFFFCKSGKKWRNI